MTDWSDVVARARGLAGRLLGRERLLEASRTRDLPALAELLDASGCCEPGEAARRDPVLLDRSVRRIAAERLDLLLRWSASRGTLLAPLYEDEDCRSLRAVLRGILAGVPLEQRLSGLLPTPALPEPALAELARQPDVRRAAALLVAWGHPYGTALLAGAARQQPDALQLQLALDRRYAERASRVAAAAGAFLRRYVGLQLDLGSAWTAIALADGTLERDPAELFVPGGRAVPLELYFEAAHQESAAAARALLVRRMRDPVLARIIGADVPRWAQEDRALGELLTLGKRVSRVEPLAPGVVVHFLLRLRAEVRDVARIVWGVALDVPRALLAQSLVTP